MDPSGGRRRPTLTRESTTLFGREQSARKPSLVASPSFRAAQQLPRYSRHSVATATLSPHVQGLRRRAETQDLTAPDAFAAERARVTELCFAARVEEPAAPKATDFLKVDFWGRASRPDHSTVPEVSHKSRDDANEDGDGPEEGGQGGAVPNGPPVAPSLAPPLLVGGKQGYAALDMSLGQLDAVMADSSRSSSSSVEDWEPLPDERPLLPDDKTPSSQMYSRSNPLLSAKTGYMRLHAIKSHGTLSGTESSDDAADEEPMHMFHRSGYVQAEAPATLSTSVEGWAQDSPTPAEAELAQAPTKAPPSFAQSREVGHQIIDRFHRVVELLNASPAPPTNVQLDCHREMHTLTANFRNDAVMYGRVIISEVSLPVERKTIKPLDASGILGGDKYRVGSVYFKFALDRLNIFNGDEEAAHKVAGHELKSLVQLMECNIPGLRYPLLCIVDYMGFRLIAMSTLPIKGRSSLLYGSMDGGRTVATSPETLDLTKKLANKLNLKEHGLNRQKKELRIWTPADLELHQGTDGNVYALDFSRLFPPDKPSANGNPGAVFYRLLRPEFVRKFPRPLCSDTWTSFQDPAEGEENMREIVEAHAALLDQARAFGASLDRERVQPDLSQASEKLINLMHMRGLNCRYLGHVRAACASPYWRLVALLEMVLRRLKKLLFRKFRRAMLRKDVPGVSLCIAVALRFLNRTVGESDASTDFWQHRVRGSVHEYFDRSLSDEELSSDIPFKEFVCSPENSRILMNDVRAQVLTVFCQKTGLKLSSLARASVKNNPRVIRVPEPFDDADLHELGVSVTYVPIASFSGGKLKRLTAMDTARRAKAYELNLSAAKLYAQALRMNPADAQLLRNCAEVEAALGNDLRANEFFCLAMEVDPTDAATAFKYAIFYDHAMQLDLAEKWYLRALELVVKGHRVPVMAATYADFLLTERRNVAVARELYERILVSSPQHTQTLHNLAVLLYEADSLRAKTLFKQALENAESESRVALLSRSCAMFHLNCNDVVTGMSFYQAYKERKDLIATHPPTLYHATRSQFGPEMDEIRQILGPTNQFKVRHIFWDDVENKSATRKNLSLRERLQRSIQRLFDRLQVPCSTEISYLSLGDLQVPAWEFDAQNIVAWAQEHQGQDAVIGIVLGFMDSDGLQLFEETLEGTIVMPPQQTDADGLDGWNAVFRVKGFGKTISEMIAFMSMLNVRRRAYLRMWSQVSSIFEVDADDEDWDN